MHLAGVLLIGCSEGGTSIEDLAEKYPDKIVRIPVDIREGITDAQACVWHSHVSNMLCRRKCDSACCLRPICRQHVQGRVLPLVLEYHIKRT